MKCHTKEEKAKYVKRYLSGESIKDILQDAGISKSTLYNWIQQSKQQKSNKFNLQEFRILQNKCERQAKIIQILQSAPCTASAPLQERLRAIEEMQQAETNVNILCEALCVAKGTFYNYKLRGKHGDTKAKRRREELKPIIEEIFHGSQQTYGSGKIAAIMKDRGIQVSKNLVATIMHENGMFSIRGGAKKQHYQNQERRQNILQQNFTVSHPNEVWVSDVTYYKFRNKTYYICVILDLYARKVVGYRISTKNSTQLTKGAFKAAYIDRGQPTGLLFHSDNGSNYISKTFVDYLKSLSVQQSFSRAKVPYDNSVCEAFFKNMKTEELYRKDYKSEKDLKRSIAAYIEFYNSQRPHTVLHYRTPDGYEAEFYTKHRENPED